MFMKNINEGLSLIVLENKNDLIKGIRLFANGNDNFQMPISDFLSLIDSRILNFVEILPKNVIRDLKKVFKNNTVNAL